MLRLVAQFTRVLLEYDSELDSSLHATFVNSEAAVQTCYTKISVLKILESFQGKTRGEVLF